MPYRPEHKARTREKIVISARRLFNRRGFAAVSIDEIMAGAGLTRGGFYAHFASKGELYAEAIRAIYTDHPGVGWDGFDFSREGAALARMVVTSYLSDDHFNEVDRSCPLIALPGDVARSDDAVKAAYAEVFNAMVKVFEEGLNGDDRGRHGRALAIGALCVGGMVLARAVDDAALGEAVRGACRTLALEAGGWRDAEAGRAAA